MAIWEQAKAYGSAPGSRIQVDQTGLSYVRFLSTSFRLNEGADYGYIGFGAQLSYGGTEAAVGPQLLGADGAFLLGADGSHLLGAS